MNGPDVPPAHRSDPAATLASAPEPSLECFGTTGSGATTGVPATPHSAAVEPATITDPDRAAPPPEVDPLLDLLSERARASAVFGEPVTAEGITVVPVAHVQLGLGGAAGTVGGGVQARPLGYIEIRDGQARFRRIHGWEHLAAPVAALAAAVVAPRLLGILRGLRGRR
ncbi:hypothetical protein ACWDOP_05445 [Nocardia sp. NPDC003693]